MYILLSMLMFPPIEPQPLLPNMINDYSVLKNSSVCSPYLPECYDWQVSFNIKS